MFIMNFFSWLYRYKTRIVVSLFLIGVSIATLQSALSPSKINAQFSPADLKKNLSQEYFKTGKLKEQLKIEDQVFQLGYTVDEKLQKDIVRLMRRYRTDYSGVVVIENKTGRILASVGLKKGKHKIPSFPYSSTHPAASIFKIITAADLLSTGVDATKKFEVRGRGTTLYKYQLKNKKTRWSRYIPLKRAFAYSNNVVFGKAAINHVSSLTLYERANRWGFNEYFMKDLDCGISLFPYAENQYNLAELASGFNRDTTLSVLHSAALASVIPNGGILKVPYIVEKVARPGKDENLWRESGYAKRAVARDVAEELGDMMEDTIRIGTARGSFRRMNRRIKRNLIIGGKTGTLTGGIPRGKHDWFTAFVVPKKKEWGEGISISVLNVNVKKWYIKSAKMAQMIISNYYKRKERK